MSKNGHNSTSPLPITPTPIVGVGDMGPLLTVGEVAELLKVPASWVYEHTRKRTADRIPGFRLGKYWRFRSSDVLAWLEQQKIGTRANA